MVEGLERYSRQMMITSFGTNIQRRLIGSSVAVAGAGGLGSAVLLYLAAAGVGRMVVLDHDRVELSNLNRQVIYTVHDVGQYKAAVAQRFLSRFNPDIAVESLNAPVAESGFDFGTVDVIVDATDNFEARYYLNSMSLRHGKPFIYGSVYGREGRVASFLPGKTACFRCLYPSPGGHATRPVLGVCPGVAGNLQAAEVLNYLASGRLALAGRLLIFDLHDMNFDNIAIPRERKCIDCGGI